MIENFQKCCKRAIMEGETNFITALHYSNEPTITKIDTDQAIPWVYVKPCGGHHALFIQDKNFENLLTVSKIYGSLQKLNSGKKWENYIVETDIDRKPIKFVFTNQDYKADTVYEENEQAMQWLLSEHNASFNFQKKGSKITLAHFSGNDTTIDFSRIKKKIDDMKEKDKIYDRQRKSCQHASLEIVLSESVLAELKRSNLLKSLSPDEALPIIINYGIKNKQRVSEMIDFHRELLNDDESDLLFVDKIKKLIVNTPEYAVKLGLAQTENRNPNFKA